MKNGDVIAQTSLKIQTFNPEGKLTLQMGLSVDPGQVIMSLLLGGTTKAKSSTFDTVAALNRLGWYGLEDAELDTVLAALRRWQQHLQHERQSHSAYHDEGLSAIATGEGQHPPLTHDEIDALCERLNLGGDHAPT